MKNKSIGIFDSGAGGLTVVREVVNTLPNESIIYLGDTARIPYGTRSKTVVTKFATELVEFLLKQDVKILVAACNTISATCLEEIQRISPVPIVGVVKPAARAAAAATKVNKIGVIGTRGTIGSGVYEKELKALKPEVEALAQACPLFVPIAEEGMGDSEVARLTAKQYLKVFEGTGIDTLILGCTHYPLLKNVIQEVVGENITLVDSAKPTAEELKQTLEEKNLLNDGEPVKNKFFVTDAPERVFEIADSFLGRKVIPSLEKIEL
ncbi:MAG: glutamate racemase [bacterium]|nr:glutamate racemase [bacterium]